MSTTVNRRTFLKMMGVSSAGATLAGCDLPTTVTLEEGKEEVVSYLMPEEYVIPGIGVWYASSCTQCASGCGIHGRVREGRVLKLEGNPDSPINKGKLCTAGQAGLQGHYNPDRLTSPMLRRDGSLSRVSWDEALTAIADKLGSISGDRFAWFTGTVSGHQAAMIGNHLEAMGANRHYVHEIVNDAVLRRVNRDMFGEENPRLRIDKARMVLSFGDDFLGNGQSPLYYSEQYRKFRTENGRGLLVQIESKMSVTGGNADLWLAIKPGTEGVLALGLANQLLNEQQLSDAGIPVEVRSLIDEYPLARAAELTGITAERITRIAALLAERSPSLVLAGPAVEGHTYGYAATAAVMTLNHILGNAGRTIESTAGFPFPQLQAQQGDNAALVNFSKDAADGALDAVVFYATNPVYTAPEALNLSAALGKIGFKIALSQFMDETTAQADVVLPLASYLEDWGTQVPTIQPEGGVMHMQQPLMQKLYTSTQGFGDIVLTLLKQRQPDNYNQFADYYGYLRNAFAAMPAGVKGGASDDDFWISTLQTGVIPMGHTGGKLQSRGVSFSAPLAAVANDGALMIVPSPRAGLMDGRHANLPWLQEMPDPISKVVWDSWAELHPATAEQLGIKNGDLIRVTTDQGSLEVRAVLLKSIHRDAIAIPLGQGHASYGRYAKGLGVNPLKILNTTQESTTGELALYSTPAKVTRLSAAERLGIVRMGASDTQMGRKLVATIPVEQLRRTEGV